MSKVEMEAAPETVSPVAFAKEVGLRYVTDRIPGIRREKKRDNFKYIDSSGNEVTDEKTLERIKQLRIPPAWEDVWVCPKPNGHLQATGVDSKGRKQYRYHANWEIARNNNKFTKMLAFGKSLSKLREKIDKDIEAKGFCRNKVLAMVVSLLDNTLIRIGNKYYEKSNKSYGLTTLRNKHVKFEGKELKISFVGKKNISQEVVLSDKRLVKLVQKCRELPGYQLFQYYDEEGNKHPVDSEDVNEYLREITGIDLSAKDFRTWGGSTAALKKLLEEPKPEEEKETQKKIKEAIEYVASKLGNTVAVCRKYYVHPLVLQTYANGDLQKAAPQSEDLKDPENEWLQPEEIMFLNLLEKAES